MAEVEKFGVCARRDHDAARSIVSEAHNDAGNMYGYCGLRLDVHRIEVRALSRVFAGT